MARLCKFRLCRHRSIQAVCLWGAGLVLLLSNSASGQDINELAARGSLLVKERCYVCHGETFNGSAQLNVLDPAALAEHGYVVAGSLEESGMWQRVESGDMPPEDSGIPPLNAEERQLLADWIAAGAPQVQRQVRAFKPLTQVIHDIHTDITAVPREDRIYQRYFTLTHLANNYEQVSDFDMRLYRAAFVKALNSLSYQPDIHHPVFIDTEQTICRIDLRRVGWDSKTWVWLTSNYPYGIHYHHALDEQLADVDRRIDELSGCQLCYLRADWFINHATRPPVYDRLARIPDHVGRLEHTLNVNFEANYRDNNLARAGFATSGVSTGNRLVERHSALFGYYWKSYDFTDKGAEGNLFRFPLGPDFPSNRYPEMAFEHDGGEMIFSLPNGLQAYMLTDEKGNKIDRGPIAVVRDSKEISGNPEVLNGLSCMHCHRHGMIGFEDSVRDGLGVFGAAASKVRQLYPEKEKMLAWVNQDRQRFMVALQQCIGPYLQVEDDANRPIEDFAEPVGAVARFYQRDLNAISLACEVGFESPEKLCDMIKFNRDLIRLGLAPIANGATIKRSQWESRDAFVSPFQETVRIIGKATPLN